MEGRGRKRTEENGRAEPLMDNPKWTASNGQHQMDNTKWTRSHCHILHEFTCKAIMATCPFGIVHLGLSIWGCPFGVVHLVLSIWCCPFEAVHLGLSIRGSAVHSLMCNSFGAVDTCMLTRKGDVKRGSLLQFTFNLYAAFML
jgi:hypothetical protein